MSSRGEGDSLDRRRFLLGLGAAMLMGRQGDGTTEGPSGRAAAKLGRIGIQLYTVRGELAKDADGTLGRLAAIGFKEVEFAGYPAGTPQALRETLKRHGLTAPSSHVGIQALRRGWERTLDQAATVGQQYIVVASVPVGQRRTVDDWKRLASLFSKGGETARSRGIQFAYHNHDFEFTPIEGELPYEVLLRESDPALVQAELDLYWATKAGQDPVAWFTRWPGRFPLLHVKDMDATPRKHFAPVGKGVIDFPKIFRQAKPAGVKHYFYEQDEAEGSPLDAAKVSYDYLKALTF